MSSKKQTKAENVVTNKENKRLEKLNKQYLKDKKSLDADRRKLAKETKEVSVSKRKLITEKKQFKNDQKKLHLTTSAMKKRLSRLEIPASGSRRSSRSHSRNHSRSRSRSRTRSAGNFFEAGFSDEFDDIVSPGIPIAISPWKAKYKKESTTRRQLQREVNDLQYWTKFFKKQLKKNIDGGVTKNANQTFLRKMRHMEKDLRCSKRKLRLAVLDMEKACAYYRRQVMSFKLKQTQLFLFHIFMHVQIILRCIFSSITDGLQTRNTVKRWKIQQ